MTSWVTFKTIDESQNWDEFYIDRLGIHQYRSDERTRFELKRTYHPTPKGDFGSVMWIVTDLEAEDDEIGAATGSMREVIQWVAGRMVYGA